MSTKSPLRMVEGEVLVSLCNQCKCCLPRTGHCYTCHVSTSIARMCGCGECDGKADAFVELQAMRDAAHKVNFTSKARLKR